MVAGAAVVVTGAPVGTAGATVLVVGPAVLVVGAGDVLQATFELANQAQHQLPDVPCAAQPGTLPA